MHTSNALLNETNSLDYFTKHLAPAVIDHEVRGNHAAALF